MTAAYSYYYCASEKGAHHFAPARIFRLLLLALLQIALIMWRSAQAIPSRGGAATPITTAANACRCRPINSAPTTAVSLSRTLQAFVVSPQRIGSTTDFAHATTSAKRQSSSLSLLSWRKYRRTHSSCAGFPSSTWSSWRFYSSNDHGRSYQSSWEDKIIRQNLEGTERSAEAMDAAASLGLENEIDYTTNSYHNNHEDTIFALSSGSGVFGGQATAVAVIRISGPLALAALQQLTPKVCPPRVATLVKLQYQGRLLDQALVLYFPQPNSFTGEHVVELHCHGSRAVVQDILSTLEQMEVPVALSAGGDELDRVKLRYAEAGEFTSRAFAAGKLDLLQVEALADLLAADTVLQKQQALSQLQGDLSRLYQDWKQQLIGALAHAEAIIDFGDDEHLLEMDHALLNDKWNRRDEDPLVNVDDTTKAMVNGAEAQQQIAQQSIWGGVTEKIRALSDSMRRQLNNAQRGEWVRQGFSIAIVGPPNAGKSSLFNILAQDEQAAIVSPIQGTTRDVLTVSLNLGGMKCRLLDTAGLRSETSDTIEQEGIKRALKAAAQADLVLVLLDAASLLPHVEKDVEAPNHPPNTERNATDATSLDTTVERELNRLVPESEIPRKNVMLVLNKADLLNTGSNEKSIAEQNLPFPLNSTKQKNQLAASYNISCKTQEGMDYFLQGLTDHIVRRVMGSPGGANSPQSLASDKAQGNQEYVGKIVVGKEEDPLMTRGRHRQHVQAALKALDRFLTLQQDGLVSVDLAAEELRLAASELGRLTGAVDVEDVLDQLFTDFCIGK
ncbi:hypothetical protein ACA910_009010 [Epithemia clementina (nom. ined.)]